MSNSTYNSLSPWDKIGIMMAGGAFVGLTILIVVCTVGHGCLLHQICFKREYESLHSQHKKSRRRVRIRSCQNFEECTEESSDFSKTERSRISPGPETQNEINENLEQLYHEKINRGVDFYRERLLRHQRSDSTYGSMSSGRSSPTGMSLGNAFSTLSLSISRAPSVKKSVAITSPSIPLSPTSSASSIPTTPAHRTSSLPKDSGKDKSGLTCINVSLALDQNIDQTTINNDDGSTTSTKMARLTIVIHDAKNLSPRDYCVSRDPFIRVSVLKDRRSLRKKTKQCLAEFNTKTVKHQLNPEFEQTFSTELPVADVKNIRVKIFAMDYDRHTKICPIGSTSIQLKDIKSIFVGNDLTNITNFLTQRKQDFGEIMFGLSYLPTAQRVSFSILKATNLKYDEIVDNLETFRPYVRIVQFNLSGKVVKKKKTGYQEGTKEPIFNDTLNFDVPPNQLESVSFVILVSHKRQSLSDDEVNIIQDTIGVLTDRSELGASAPSSARSHSPFPSNYPSASSSLRGRDCCVGRVCIGANVRGEKERNQWMSVMANPRKVFTQWQTLY